MLCVLCLIVLWGFSLVTSYSGVIDASTLVVCAIDLQAGTLPFNRLGTYYRGTVLLTCSASYRR